MRPPAPEDSGNTYTEQEITKVEIHQPGRNNAYTLTLVILPTYFTSF